MEAGKLALEEKMEVIPSDKTPPPAAATSLSKWGFSCDLEVNYESERKVHIVYSALAIDEELQPDKVKRQMSVSDGKLLVHFEAVEPRFLRASFNAFVDVLTLATNTIEEFDQGAKNLTFMSEF